VLYKIDRISRSLIDFARIIDFLEKREVSLVSISQQFNSASSIGRLTLNILMSFSEFERQIIAERTSDKMCAARKKGKFVGGIPMLGYDVAPGGGKLIVNQEDAHRVQEIYRLYLRHQSLAKTAQELNSRGWTTKAWVKKDGSMRLGKPFNKTNLYSLLTNMIYLGKVEHQGEVYNGEQEAIVDETTWARVQQVMENNSRSKGQNIRNFHGALLRGLIVCGSCQKSMTHTYTKKKDRLYRYYVCETASKQGYDLCPTRSVPAKKIEDFVVNKIKKIGKDPAILQETGRKLLSQQRSQLSTIDADGQYLRKELTMLKRQLKSSGNGQGREVKEDQTSDLNERIKQCEKRLSEVNRQKILLENTQVDEEELKTALGLFDPVWDVLFPNEQARIINLVIEKIIYNGEKGTITINFRTLGIKTLAEEARIKNEKK
jgi:site-specific DNA recombinase